MLTLKDKIWQSFLVKVIAKTRKTIQRQMLDLMKCLTFPLKSSQ